MRRLALTFAALLTASSAWADAWVGGSLSGSGRTEALAMCYAHTSTKATCIARRATSVTNVGTVYTVSSAGIAASAVSPTAPSLSNTGKVMLVGGNATTLLIGGGGGTGRWLDSSPLSSISWTVEKDDTAGTSGYGFSGVATPTSPDKTFQHSQFSGTSQWMASISIGPWSAGNFIGNAPAVSDQELISTSINASYYCIVAGDTSSGTPTFRGYTSGASFAYTTTSGPAVMSASSYYYPLFGLGSTACVSTIKRANNSHTYIQSAPIGGTITTVDAGVIDLMPLGDWDPTGSLRRAWWVNKADGTVRVSNSGTTVGSISTNATYDIGSTPLAGSTPLFAIMGLDVDRDGTATDNPVVMMADGSHFAAWGACVDADGDGYPGADSIFCSTHTEDCNDGSASIHPGATETPNDGIDQDCSGVDLVIRPVARASSLGSRLRPTIRGRL